MRRPAWKMPLILCLLAMASLPAVAQRVDTPIANDIALGSGLYKAVPRTEPGLPGYTVYAPAQLRARDMPRLPIVVWGEGGCIDNGTRYRWFLSEIASHGFLVVAVGPMMSPEDQVWPPEAPPAGPPVKPDVTSFPPAPTRTPQLNHAIDWAIAENVRRGSRFFGRVETSRIAVMGTSCGGVQAIGASLADPRVTTTVVWNMGLFAEPALNATAGGGSITRSELARLPGSVAYISGDRTDIAYDNANDDFAALRPDVAALRAWRKDTPHNGTFAERNGGDFGRVAVAWLKWQLRRDGQAAALFTGADCGLCRDPAWTVKALPGLSSVTEQKVAAKPLQIVVYGGSGNIGSRIVKEALARGHRVTLVDRVPKSPVGVDESRLTLRTGDVFSMADISRNIAGKDVIVSAVSARATTLPDPYVRLATTVVEALRAQQGEPGTRFVMVGGAASLLNGEGRRVFDALEPIPAEYRGELLSLVQALDYLRTVKDVKWTFFSPAMQIMPGNRTGRFRLGTDQMVTDDQGRSAISMEDYAAAMLDEIEKPQFLNRRFTVGY